MRVRASEGRSRFLRRYIKIADGKKECLLVLPHPKIKFSLNEKENFPFSLNAEQKKTVLRVD